MNLQLSFTNLVWHIDYVVLNISFHLTQQNLKGKGKGMEVHFEVQYKMNEIR